MKKPIRAGGFDSRYERRMCVDPKPALFSGVVEYTGGRWAMMGEQDVTDLSSIQLSQPPFRSLWDVL